ncbi:MAG: N-6 DNA methylase [Gammaproteobacteria bacterium]|nr:N-6 DNA methylase [Gammaproteobacteria bacterium]
MKTLSTEHRRQLERTVVNAREVAETGARAALEALAVDGRDPFEHMSEGQRALRRRLRAHARHLGDKTDGRSGKHGIDHLTHEGAYEHWHAMLFARFLAENKLLIEPELAMPVTLDECEELAKDEGTDRWTLASRFAQRMLPQVFRPDHPVLEVRLAYEHRVRLEQLVEGLPAETFEASDALGWVYQFWQARKKDEVNRSEAKIGANELPAVTQLFTEPYMVQFLLHNSLGAWWESRHPDKPCPVDLTYLRHADDGAPAAGTFDGWPNNLSEFRLLDPCCGSGHFLVTALLILVPMRMRLEGLDAPTAVNAVLRENLHGLEIDQRCIAIAAFTVALEAWRYPDAGGYRQLPRFNLAWCGQPPAAGKEEWLSLADGDAKVEAGMAALHEAFRDAPTLGSLIDPMRSAPNDLLTAGLVQLRPLLERALERHTEDAERAETAIAALGIAGAAEMLSGRFHLVVTNVPYLSRRKQSEQLRRFCKSQYARAQHDLANVFLERCLELSREEGTAQVVMPQNWLGQTSYRAEREGLLREASWELLARLGEGGFESTQAAGAFTILLTLSKSACDFDHRINGVEAREPRTPTAKAKRLRCGDLVTVVQRDQLAKPGATVDLINSAVHSHLGDVARCYQGLTTGDDSRLKRLVWEFGTSADQSRWVHLQGPCRGSGVFGGRQSVVDRRLVDGGLAIGALRGKEAWGKRGVAIDRVRSLSAAHYTGEHYHSLVPVLIPRRREHLSAIVAFAFDRNLRASAGAASGSLSIDNGYFENFEFDFEKWKAVGVRAFPNGVPLPFTDDPAQWIFHGHPCGSVVWDDSEKRTTEGPLRTDDSVLHVAVARLLGYRWPAEQDPEMELADEQREWVARCEPLHEHEDKDGIVCIPSIRGERSADERLLDLIRESYAGNWNEGITAKLLDDRRTTLEDWLRNRFFDQHCRLFHHRPFIWHVWDGRKGDGFHALVNYHRLAEGGGAGRQVLESLAYSYLGDWIARQRDGVARGEAGSDDRLAAALELQKRLAAIIEGEPPFDLFVRWKPLGEQAIGWNPDLNDGVRLNIRPFMADDILGGKKGAGILRSKPNVHWGKDRGKEPQRDESDFPWFWADGSVAKERVNDRHFSNAEKRAARKEA